MTDSTERASAPRRLLAIAGSLRRGSLNRAALVAAQELAPPTLTVDIYDLRPIPFYDGDLDREEGPEPVRAFKARIADADGLLIATPEYNYSIPGVLKNALDWASRPAYRSVLAGKPVAILGVAGSSVGTARAQGHLKQVLSGTLSHLFPYPEVLVGGANQKFDGEGRLVDEATRKVLAGLLQAFDDHLARQRAR